MKSFCGAPLDFTRVSSNFNPNRLHPIYKTQRPMRDRLRRTSRHRYTPPEMAREAGYTRPMAGMFSFNMASSLRLTTCISTS